MSSGFLAKTVSNETKKVSSFLDLLDAVHNCPDDTTEGSEKGKNEPSLLNLLDAIHEFQDDTNHTPAYDSSDSEGFLPIKKELDYKRNVPEVKPKLNFPSGVTIKKVATPIVVQKHESPTHNETHADPLSIKIEPDIEIKEEILELINEDYGDDVRDDDSNYSDELPLKSPPKPSKVKGPSVVLPDIRQAKQSFVDLLKGSASKKCHFCDLNYPNTDGRLIHELELHLDCGYMGFNAETDWQKDRVALLAFWNKRKHNDSQACFFCKKEFLDKTERFEHEKVAHGVELVEKLLPSEEEGDVECGICGKKLSKLRLKLHFQADHGIGSSFDLFDDKIQLMASRLDASTLYCMFCHRKFQYKARRVSHEREYHLKLFEYDDIFRKDSVTKCTVCNASSNDSMALLSHRCSNRLLFTEPVEGLIKLTPEERQVQAAESKKRQGIRCKFCFQHFHEPYKRWRHEIEKHLGVKWADYRKDDKKGSKSSLEYACVECGHTAKNSSELREHQRVVHDTEDYAGKSLTVIRSRAHSQMVVFLSSIEEVQKMQDIMKDETYDCVLCGKHFEHRYRRTDHQYQVHYRARWQCLICNAVMLDRTIGRHLWDEHQLKEDVHATTAKCCSFCGKQFSSAKNAKIHEYRVHSENFAELVIACPYCDKRVIQRNDLRRHVEIVHPAEATRCPNCNTICINAEELVNHDCDPSKACKKCHRKFSGPRSMLAHQETCKGPPPAPTPKVTPGELFPCTEPGCKQVFKSLAGRVSHVKAKQAIRAKLDLDENQPVYYKCDECEATFARRKLLYVHKRRHRWRRGEIERKKCKLCGKRLFDITRLRTHMKSHGVTI